jgi:hypothetical protein
VGAREFLDQARIFMQDTALEALSNEGRQLLLHQAAVCACDAILLVSGLQIAGGEGGHLLRLEQALKQLPEDTDELFDALDSSRARRVEASYRAGPVPAASVQDADEATRELLALAEGFVG